MPPQLARPVVAWRVAVVALVCCACTHAAVYPHTPPATDVSCDVVVAGGSTASLAAAITAAEADPTVRVCFTEITDWPGGQMTAGGVPAIDFGHYNRLPDNMPRSFRDFWAFLPGNPGACSVSPKCYQPQIAVQQWIMPRLRASPNLDVFLRTAVIGTTRDSASGNVTSVAAVQRRPVDAAKEWSVNLSEELPDWYSPVNSTAFTKTTLTLRAPVFIEATELADVLVMAGLPFTQGVETPAETSAATNALCGQAWTLTFYMQLLAQAPKHPVPVPAGGTQGLPFPDPASFDWRFGWTYRRAKVVGNTSLEAVNVGDVSQQNLGNDLDSAYVPLPIAPGSVPTPWDGGLNLTALKMLEGRAYGYYHYMVNTTLVPAWRDRLVMNYTVSGTRHGLSKFPYLRDTRRGYGLGGFRLVYNGTFDYYNASAPCTGYHFADTVALDNYNDDTHHLHTCTYPAYMAKHTTKPFYIPFRALTVGGAPNLLVAGKTMSQSFHANGATRLHPSEWSSGVAAGGAAVYMLHHHLPSTAAVLADVSGLRSFLNSSAVGQPLEWALGPVAPGNVGWECAFGANGRCVGVDKPGGHGTVHNTSTCDAACTPLAATEWLADAAYWTVSGGAVVAGQQTWLKKSTAYSGALPDRMKLQVSAGTSCALVPGVGAAAYNHYYLCSLAAEAVGV